jgi:hypothetical protein
LIIDASTRDALLSEKDNGTIFCHHQECVKFPFPDACIDLACYYRDGNEAKETVALFNGNFASIEA